MENNRVKSVENTILNENATGEIKIFQNLFNFKNERERESESSWTKWQVENDKRPGRKYP